MLDELALLLDGPRLMGTTCQTQFDNQTDGGTSIGRQGQRVDGSVCPPKAGIKRATDCGDMCIGKCVRPFGYSYLQRVRTSSRFFRSFRLNYAM